jgi:hypothetical protein
MGWSCSTHVSNDIFIPNSGIKSESKRPLARHRREWKVHIRMDLREMRWENVDWIHVAQDKDHVQVLVNTVIHF